MEGGPEKLSETLRCRVSPAVAGKVHRLASRSRWGVSDILRTALETFWPEIESLVLAQSGHVGAITPALARTIREAQALGLDVPAILRTELKKFTT